MDQLSAGTVIPIGCCVNVFKFVETSLYLHFFLEIFPTAIGCYGISSFTAKSAALENTRRTLSWLLSALTVLLSVVSNACTRTKKTEKTYMNACNMQKNANVWLSG